MSSTPTSSPHLNEKENKIEEGQVVEGWSHVSLGKLSRSPQKTLEYGQMRIITPSKFAALNNAKENGDLVTQEEADINFESENLINSQVIQKILWKSEKMEKMEN